MTWQDPSADLENVNAAWRIAQQQADDLDTENRHLHAENERLRAENDRLRKQVNDWADAVDCERERGDRLSSRVKHLNALLDQELRQPGACCWSPEGIVGGACSHCHRPFSLGTEITGEGRS